MCSCRLVIDIVNLKTAIPDANTYYHFNIRHRLKVGNQFNQSSRRKRPKQWP